MKKQAIIACISLLALVAGAQTQETPSVVKSKKSTMKATVTDVNRDEREITVRGARGEHVIKASDAVKNFNEIREGDQIQATYYQSVALSLAKEGEATPSPTAGGVVQVLDEGGRPAGVAAATMRATVTVEDVDRAAREVTLKGPEGNSRTVQVSEKIGDLSRIKKGDRINIEYTESLAVAIQKQ